MSSLTRSTDWFPIAASRELSKGKILARKFMGIPLVLFRNQEGHASALHDRCPHRFAPLSLGKLLCGEIVCPYHGWQFNAIGQCTRVPGLIDTASSKSLIKHYPAYESHGLIWIANSATNNSPLATGVLADTSTQDIFFLTDSLRSTPMAIAENFLDGFHTHFVHAGWIRTPDKRQQITATIQTIPHGIEVTYRGETKQSGFISRWLESARGISMGRFYLPGIAEIEYRDPNGKITFLASLWLTPEDELSTRVHVRIATHRHWMPSWLKNKILARIFTVILKQDKAILEAISKNQHQFSLQGLDTEPLSTTNDLLSPYIKTLFEKGFLEDFTISRSINL